MFMFLNTIFGFLPRLFVEFYAFLIICLRDLNFDALECYSNFNRCFNMK